ncbi:Tc toxin subunit A [Pseudomonas sp. LB3P25]
MDTPSRLAKQFYESVFDTSERASLSALNQFFEEEGSVCVLAQKGVDGLVSEYGVSRHKAQALLERVNPLATLVLRRFIDHERTGVTGECNNRSGWSGLVSGPTYTCLFDPKFDNLCPPQAIEAIHSPAAYAVFLGHWSQYRLGLVDDTALPLKGRRTDLDQLRVDVSTVNGSVSSVEVVTQVMETFIEQSIGQIQSIDKALSLRRYPNGLPFHRPWVTLDYVARQSAESVGSVRRLCDPHFPYFLHGVPWSDESDAALCLAVRLSVEQRTLLTEAPHFPPDEINEPYFKHNFGLVKVEPQNLFQVGIFNDRTKLDQPGIEALLSIKDFVTTLSGNVVPKFAEPISGAHSGSVFINGGSFPAISIRFYENRALNMFDDSSRARIDRMNRKLRLDKWLALHSHEVDALLSAAIDAEDKAPETPPCWITNNTIRALGLFQELRERYECTAEDFSAFVRHISIFGRGTQAAQFDRIFNERTLFPRPLKVDDGEFPIIPLTEAHMLTINQIRSGLGIDLETYLYLAQLIANVHGVTALRRNVPILSSFYRMVKLPRLIGITPIEAIVLLKTLGLRDSWLNALAGVPRISADQDGSKQPDVLSVIHALVDGVRWCREADLAVHWVAQHVQPIIVPARPSDAEFTLFAQLMSQIPPALLTEELLNVSGVPLLPGNRQWLDVLKALVDEKGLVLHFAESMALPYETYARDMIDRAVTAAIPDLDERERLLIVEKIIGVVLRCRSGQHGVVQEGLGGYARLVSERVLLVLNWSGGSVHQVLTQVMSRSVVDEVTGARRQDSDIPDDALLALLAEFLRRSSVARTLELSPAFLRYYLEERRKHRLGQQQAQEFSLATLYHLTVYKRAQALTGKPEEQLLDYLQRVNALPDNLVGDGKTLVQNAAAKLLAELFAWSTREVLVCAFRVSPDEGLIRTVAQLDLLLRVRAFAKRSGLDAEAILAMGTLIQEGSYEHYDAVAERVTASLTEPGNPAIADDIGSVEQDVLMDVTVSPARLIANKPDQFATYTVMVKNRAGTPQKRVNVHWQSTLGRLSAPMTTTNDDGTATVRLYAGAVMGTAMAFYEQDLGEKQVGPSVDIGFDQATLDLYDKSEVPVEPVVETLVTLSVTLLDNYHNLGADQTVEWILEPLFQPPIQTTTNRAGVAEVTFTNAEPQTVKVTAKILANGKTSLFRDIKFIPRPE